MLYLYTKQFWAQADLGMFQENGVDVACSDTTDSVQLIHAPMNFNTQPYTPYAYKGRR